MLMVFLFGTETGFAGSSPIDTRFDFAMLTKSGGQFHFNKPLLSNVVLPLPTDFLEAGWSCTRPPIDVDGSKVMGTIDCVSPAGSVLTMATCKTQEVDSDSSNFTLTAPDGNILVFVVSCKTYFTGSKVYQ